MKKYILGALVFALSVNSLISEEPVAKEEKLILGVTVLKKDGIEIRLAPRSQDYGRLLIVIPKRSGKAAKRNQIRRRIKSIFYEEKLFELPFDWIIFVKKEGIGMSFEKLKEIMQAVA